MPSSLPHSATVRGTFGNPNFSTRNIAPPLGDPTSLEREKMNSVRTGSSQALNPYGDKDSERSHEVNRSMLGDAVSLKAETSERGEWKGSKL